MSEKKIYSLDSSRLDSLQNCMFLYKTKYIDHTRSNNTPLYLERGSLIHILLDQYYKMKMYIDRWQRNGKSYRDITQVCITVGRNAARKMQIDLSEVERVIEVFLEYTDLWENEDWIPVFTEKVGSKVLYEDDSLIILYEVKIDLGIQVGSKVVSVDHKHSGQRRDPNVTGNQFKGYCWFLGNNHHIVNEVGFQKTIKPSEKFRRHTLEYPDSILQEWVDNTVIWVKQAIMFEEAGIFPRNFTSCDKYSGCDLREDICSKDPDIREFKFKQFFHIEEWNPGKNL